MNPKVRRASVILRDASKQDLPTYLQGGNELRERHKQEVQVEEELELLVEDKGQKSDNIVLLIANNIRRKSSLKFLYAMTQNQSVYIENALIAHYLTDERVSFWICL